MLKLIKEHPKLIFYFFCCAFFSGYGQTFLLSLFNKDLQAYFQLSDTQLGSVYSVATLMASMFLPILGRVNDHFHLKKIIIPLGFVLGGAYLLMAKVKTWPFLLLSYVLIRASGQSGISLTVMSQVTRVFGQYRGRLLGLYGLGRSLAEAALPFVVLWVLSSFDMAGKLTFLGLSVMILLPLLSLILLPGDFGFKKIYAEKEEVGQFQSKQEAIYHNWKRVYSDKRIYFIVMGDLVLPFVMTGFFFQVHNWIEWKGWTIEWWGKAMFLYASFQLFFNLISGVIIDKITAIRLMPFTHLPMFLAMVIFGFYQSEASLVFVMILLGCCLGTTANCRNALTAELFGPKFLATLKSITSTLVVISSAIAPIAFAWINKYGHFNYSVYLMMSLSLLTIPAYYLGIHLYKKQ